MNEKEQTLGELTKPIQFVQGTDWTAFYSHVDEHLVAKMGCLVNAYQRITPQGLNEMSVKRLKEFLELTRQIQKGIEGGMSHVRQGYPRAAGGVLGGVKEQCEEALLIAQECADRGAANKARRKEVETLLAEMRVQQEEVKIAATELRSQQKEAQASFRKKMDAMDASVRQKTESLEGRVTQLGASLHAAFFKQEADKHEKAAEVWKKGVWGAATVLAVYAVASIFLSAIPWLEGVDTVQLAVARRWCSSFSATPCFSARGITRRSATTRLSTATATTR